MGNLRIVQWGLDIKVREGNSAESTVSNSGAKSLPLGLKAWSMGGGRELWESPAAGNWDLQLRCSASLQQPHREEALAMNVRVSLFLEDLLPPTGQA